MQGGFTEQKFQIPQMSIEDIAKWYTRIRPIVNDGKIPTYLRSLSQKELTQTAYTWLNTPSDYVDAVDFSKLSVLADVKMLHKWCYHGFFKPDVGEVIRQIPKEFLERTIAFQIINGPIGMNSIYNKELNAGFHVSVVRLYQAKDDTNQTATPITCWPNKDSKCPINMTTNDFESIKNFFGC